MRRKLYLGNAPSADEGWDRIGSYLDDDGIEWLAFVKAQDHSPDWRTVKIVANGRAELKANYWLAKNISTGQIGYARDYVLMRDNRPQLHARIESMLDELRQP